jgi:hypothetical protein
MNTTYVVIMPWRHGIVVVASASAPKDRGVESRRSVRFLQFIHCNAVVQNLKCIVVVVCVFEENECQKIHCTLFYIILTGKFAQHFDSQIVYKK